MKKIVVRVQTELDGYHWEKLEDTIAECVREFGVEGEVESEATENSIGILRPTKRRKCWK